MRISILILLAAVVASQTAPETEVKNINISVNKTAIEELKEDWRDYSKYYREYMRDEMDRTNKAFANAIKTT